MHNDIRYIRIYCDEGHDRFVVISYGRVDRAEFPGGHDWVPDRVLIGSDGRQRLARTHHVHQRRGVSDDPLLAPGVPKQSFRYRFRCPHCGFDEQRKDTPDPDVGFTDVLDRLSANGVAEIPVRRFIAIVWG